MTIFNSYIYVKLPEATFDSSKHRMITGSKLFIMTSSTSLTLHVFGTLKVHFWATVCWPMLFQPGPLVLNWPNFFVVHYRSYMSGFFIAQLWSLVSCVNVSYWTILAVSIPSGMGRDHQAALDVESPPTSSSVILILIWRFVGFQ
jgi:hypothetical protein